MTKYTPLVGLDLAVFQGAGGYALLFSLEGFAHASDADRELHELNAGGHTGAAADNQVVRVLVVGGAPLLMIEASTLRGYGSYLGLEIWSGVNAYDSPCLVAEHRVSGSRSEADCAPGRVQVVTGLVTPALDGPRRRPRFSAIILEAMEP